VNNADTNKLLNSLLEILDPFININTDRPASYKAAGRGISADCNWSTRRLLLHSIPNIAREINT